MIILNDENGRTELADNVLIDFVKNTWELSEPPTAETAVKLYNEQKVKAGNPARCEYVQD